MCCAAAGLHQDANSGRRRPSIRFTSFADEAGWRAQVPNSKYTEGFLAAIMTVSREEGPLTLYTGLRAELLKSCLQNGLYFYWLIRRCLQAGGAMSALADTLRTGTRISSKGCWIRVMSRSC